ncbi:larval cuticle protein 1-like [Arctopsyche grandis]|uniref:larval cuticle protein 1-like n=1 Tax=Arctopsyche grandis TaxID=121162 RepID=UPI00406D6509
MASVLNTLLSHRTDRPKLIMKVVFVFLVALALAYAAPAERDLAPVFKILKSTFDQEPAGPYQFGFQTENEIIRDEVGELKRIKNEEGKEEDVIVVRGSYSYKDPEGNPITVTFYADETGFHAEGAHIPQAP